MTRSETRNIVVRLVVNTVASEFVGCMTIARVEKRRPEEQSPGIALFIHLSATYLPFPTGKKPRMPGADFM